MAQVFKAFAGYMASLLTWHLRPVEVGFSLEIGANPSDPSAISGRYGGPYWPWLRTPDFITNCLFWPPLHLPGLQQSNFLSAIASRFRPHSSLPVYQQQQSPQLRLDTTVISLAFQAIISLIVADQFPPNHGGGGGGRGEMHRLHVFALFMLLAFACSLASLLLRSARPGPRANTQRFLEKTGYISMAGGFYLITSIFLPPKLEWICWVSSALSLLVFALVLKAEPT